MHIHSQSNALPIASLKATGANAPWAPFQAQPSPLLTTEHEGTGQASTAQRGVEQNSAGQGGSSPTGGNLGAGEGRGESDSELREAFDNFVGQTFFSQMLASMRSTQKESAYFHGGQAERIFQGQLDQILTEELSRSSGSQISGPMFDLFQLRRG